MDQLQYLKQIRNGIYVVALLSAVTIIFGFPFTYYLNEHSLKEVERMNQEAVIQISLTDELDELFEKGDMIALKAGCEALISEKPYSAAGHYYLGIAHYHLGDLRAARESMEESARVVPGWDVSVEPWIKAIEAK